MRWNNGNVIKTCKSTINQIRNKYYWTQSLGRILKVNPQGDYSVIVYFIK